MSKRLDDRGAARLRRCRSAPAAAQTAPAAQAMAGTRLDVVATGEVTRVPDIVRINAGVVTQAPTASEAIRQNAARMDAVRAALRRGRHRRPRHPDQQDQPAARLSLSREPAAAADRLSRLATRSTSASATSPRAGRILDALVAEGANQINGPMLAIERPEAALDEARTRALAAARARAELYARALGMRVKRILSVSEAGRGAARCRCRMMRMQAADAGDRDRARRAGAVREPHRQLRARIREGPPSRRGPSSFPLRAAASAGGRGGTG